MIRPLEIALVGCGAIAQRGYLPALGRVPEVSCQWLVDADRKLAGELGRRFRVLNATDDYQSALQDVEAVILAVPTHLHTPMAIQALGRGRAVLCEKPLARSAAEAHEMVAVSKRDGIPLVAGMILRQYPGLQQIQTDFPWDALGRVREVRASYGCPLDWPVSHPSFFDRERAGGGVFLDLGVHLLDALLWVMPVEDAAAPEYFDDGESGVESEARAHLTVRLDANEGEVPCLLEVSRLRRLRNSIEIRGERMSLIIPLSSTATPHLREDGDPRTPLRHCVVPRNETECFGEQIKAFARRVRGVEANCATGESQLQVLGLIDSCYAIRQPLAFSWQGYGPWN